MNSVIVNNIVGLSLLLKINCVKHQILSDGRMVQIYYTDVINLLEIGKLLAENDVTVYEAQLKP